MNRRFERNLVRLAAVGALTAALGLTACGRKSGLDLPPSAAAVPAGEPGAPARDAVAPATSHDMFGNDIDSNPRAAATSQRKNFFLDWLVN